MTAFLNSQVLGTVVGFLFGFLSQYLLQRHGERSARKRELHARIFETYTELVELAATELDRAKTVEAILVLGFPEFR
jgi:NhaP-type Na+/H+ or K+/H+ antiporter